MKITKMQTKMIGMGTILSNLFKRVSINIKKAFTKKMTKLYLTNHAAKKLRYYVNNCVEEISGFGKLEVKVHEGQRYMVVTDLCIFEQVCSAAHSTIDDDALGKFLYEKTISGEKLSEWRVWWHSHAKMKAFFSGTDTGTIDSSTEFPYLVSIVSNHEGDIIARLDTFDPTRFTQTLEVEILQEEDEELRELCIKEIEEKVSKPVYNQVGFYQGSTQDDEVDLKNLPVPKSKRWWKLKRKKGVLISGDPGFDFEASEWDIELQEFVIYPKKPKWQQIQTSTSNDNKTSTTPNKPRQQFPLSALETSDPNQPLDLDDLE